MKKTALILAIIMLVALLGGCKKSLDDGETALFDSADDAFEAMTDAIENGDYDDAVKYYNSGAADVDNPNITDYYFYSKAMSEYNEHGCIGYPLDLISNCGDFFDKKAETDKLLREKAEVFNGAYENNGKMIYILDGKIAVSNGERLSGIVFCTSELAEKNGTYFWIDRSPEGVHTLKYNFEVTDTGIKVNLAGDNTDETYVGDYSRITAEFPELCY